MARPGDIPTADPSQIIDLTGDSPSTVSPKKRERSVGFCDTCGKVDNGDGCCESPQKKIGRQEHADNQEVLDRDLSRNEPAATQKEESDDESDGFVMTKVGPVDILDVDRLIDLQADGLLLDEGSDDGDVEEERSPNSGQEESDEDGTLWISGGPIGGDSLDWLDPTDGIRDEDIEHELRSVSEDSDGYEVCPHCRMKFDDMDGKGCCKERADLEEMKRRADEDYWDVVFGGGDYEDEWW